MVGDFLGRLLVLIILSLGLSSCTKDIDFNQSKDLVLEPVLVSNLVFFNTPANNFFANGTALSVSKDSIIIDLFRRDFVVENLIKADLVFETTNSINKAFNLELDFLDSLNVRQHTFTISTPASPNNADLLTTHTEVFENASLNALKQTDKIVLTIRALAGGVEFNETTQGNIQLKSKGVFYFELQPVQ